MILMSMAIAAAGTLAKIEAKEPALEYVSPAASGDVERCLVASPDFGLPTVYRQPDRPDVATLVWLKWGEYAGAVRGHVVLERVPAGTRVRSWMPAQPVLNCAPKAG